MLPTFYFDGFRGLEQTFLSLCAVNFLVGENSTGKTSVLSAIQLLCSDAFWLTGELRNEHIDLGMFHEIATKDRASFRLGYFVESDMNHPALALLVTVEANNQTPTVTALRFLCDRAEVHVTSQEVHVTSQEEAIQRDVNITARATFLSWIAKSAQPDDGEMLENAQGRRAEKRSIRPVRACMLIDSRGKWVEPAWIAPIRARPRRTYEAIGPEYSPEGDHTPYLLNHMLSPNADSQHRQILEQYGNESGLFKNIVVHRFGGDARSPLSLDIDLGNLQTSIYNVGYGVSQVLPILAEVIVRSKSTTFLIQQPEVHLHPKAQASLGNLFFDMSRSPHNKEFLLETHSDFIIDRFCMCMRKAADAGEPVPSAQALFFQRNGDKNVITPVEISSRGEYDENQPKEFREFFLQEDLRYLGF